MPAVLVRRVLIYGGLLTLAIWLTWSQSFQTYYVTMIGGLLAVGALYVAVNRLVRRLPGTDPIWTDVNRAWWVAFIPTVAFQIFR